MASASLFTNPDPDPDSYRDRDRDRDQFGVYFEVLLKMPT